MATGTDTQAAIEAARADRTQGEALPEGYASAGYARSMRYAGTPLALPHCGGWVLERPIAGTTFRDATGCYPVFACGDWTRIGDDVKALARRGLVSLTLVADAFADLDPAQLQQHFDVVRVFKQHFVADLARAPEQIASAHHRYEARKALRRLELDASWRPLELLDEWTTLYAHLVARHRISGLRAFPATAFRDLFALDGVCLMRARHKGEMVGAQLIVLQKDVAHAHLAAFSPSGYRLGASYALDWFALDTLRDRACWIDWGGQPGPEQGAPDGLSRYKKGWSSTGRTTWLLGAILNRAAYTGVARSRDSGSSYFPVYRQGEFAAD